MMNKTKTVLFGAILATALILAGTAMAAMPQEACSNVATKIDEWVQEWVNQYPSNINSINPCSGQLEPAEYSHGPDWSQRYERWEFSDGTIKGKTYQGYFGGKITYYTICADGRAKVNGRSFGWYGMGATQEVCNTMS